MPIYEYRCEACRHQFEDLAKMSDPNPECPECSGVTHKLICHTHGITDSVFMSQIGTLRDQIGEDNIPAFEAHCQKIGFRPSERSQYCPSLAQYQFDPRAFVSSREEAVAYARSAGLGVEGAVKTIHAKPDRKKPPRLAESLVQKIEKAYIQQNPDLAMGDRSELRQQIIEKHGAPAED